MSQNKIDEVLLTSNGTQLKRYAKNLADFGIKRINVSLDSLIEQKFNFITNGGNLSNVIDGIFLAKSNNIKIKINTVLLKNFNEDEIISLMKWCGKNNFTLSFIEVMPVGEISYSRSKQYLPVTKAKEIIKKEFKLEKSELKSSDHQSIIFAKSSI